MLRRTEAVIRYSPAGKGDEQQKRPERETETRDHTLLLDTSIYSIRLSEAGGSHLLHPVEHITVPLTIEVEQEDDGRWLAEVPELPGVLSYGQTRQEAIDRVQALSLRVLADRLEHGEPVPQMGGVFALVP